MADLKLCTYNVRGLRQNKKRRQVFTFLHRHKQDIYMMQETHSLPRDEIYWTNEWGGRIVFCHGSSASRGVCVLFHPKLVFEIHRIVNCQNGRLLIIEVTVKRKLVTLVCIYGPNADEPAFYDFLFGNLRDSQWDSILIGGDFNFVFNLDIDKVGGTHNTNFHARDKCIEMMDSLNLVDIWRDRNPHCKNFTWSSNVTPGIHCRLDFFLISRSLVQFVVGNNSTPSLCSDHSIVNLHMNILNMKKGPGFWKLNNSLLKDTVYVSMITDLILSLIHSHVDDNPSSKWEFIKYSIRNASIKYSKIKARERRRRELNILKNISRFERLYFSSGLADDLDNLISARNELQHIYD